MTENPRKIAVETLFEVIKNGRSLSDELQKHSVHQKIAVIKEYCFGVCRWYSQCQNFLQQLLRKSIKAKNADIEVLLLLGIYELQHMTTAEHAVVNECVKTAVELNHQWAKGLVNAILRSFIRQKNDLTCDTLSHPDWFIEQLKKDWPKHWQEILVSNNEYPPMFLRVNRRLTNTGKYLTQHELDGQIKEHYPDAILLNTARSVAKLPQFYDGMVSVQDSSAQLAVDFLQLSSEQKILDACAAPGGKTCHMIERCPDLASLTAIDLDPQRVELITQNLDRIGGTAKLLVGDASKPDQWWDRQQYDRILLDAPCSATGVIRRHPDIKLHRTRRDIDKVAELQQTLLNQLWPTLKPGGLMLYATCSVLHQENCSNMVTFLNKTADAKEVKLEHSDALPCEYGIQFIPKNNSGDGFYYCLLEKSD